MSSTKPLASDEKLAFLGPREYHRALSFLGVKCFADEGKETAALIKKLKEDNFGLILASQDLLEEALPNVVILPGLVKRIDKNYLKKEIIKAIGSEISLSR